MLGATFLLPPLQARSVIDDGIASALYVSNYRFALQGVDYLAVSVPPSPFQHYWSLGVEEQFYLVWPALIIGTAWSSGGCAAAPGPMPLLATPISGGPCASRGGIVRTFAGTHLDAATRGVLFAAHPGLEVGRRRTCGPHRRPVAPTPPLPPRSPGGPVWAWSCWPAPG